MTSLTTKRFLELFEGLPPSIQKLARKNYKLWLNDPKHPSLHFKKLKNRDLYSVRIGDHYRAIGIVTGDTAKWIWIGSHENYDKFLGK
jgi:hypothetical protein